jgi:glycine cleavage system H protein
VIEPIHYRRSRFTTRLPADRRYTPSHFWLAEEAGGIWRVGFTQLATWLLGDPVEFDFSVRPGMRIAAAQDIGWVEGLKALQTIYSAVEGEFLEAGSEIAGDIGLIETDPYERGWLYRVCGIPGQGAVDVHRYIALLDDAVDAVIRGRESACGGECEG